MRLPVAVGDLVADQRVARRGVGNAQQRFGEAHQRHAFLARKRVFVHQTFDAGALVLGAQRLNQLASGCGGALPELFGIVAASTRRGTQTVSGVR